MPTQRKAEQLDELTELLSQSQFIVAAEYRGLTVSEISQLRRQLREAKTELHVAKNTLAKLAADKAGKTEIAQYLQGPTALAFCKGDATQLSKVMVAYAKNTKTLIIKGAVMDSKALTAKDIGNLATMPPIEVMRAKLLGVIQSPVYALQNVLSANMRGLCTLLNARIQQMGGV